MQAGPDSAAVSEAPSSGSEDSDCEFGPETEEASLTEEWARELLIDSGVVEPQEVGEIFFCLLIRPINITFNTTHIIFLLKVLIVLIIIYIGTVVFSLFIIMPYRYGYKCSS